MLLCLGRAPSQAQNKTGPARRHTGLHHACIVTPHGDYCIEPASTAAFRQPAAYEELTPAAHTTILHLLQSPPVEPAIPPPPTAASEPRPASPRPPTETDARGQCDVYSSPHAEGGGASPGLHRRLLGPRWGKPRASLAADWPQVGASPRWGWGVMSPGGGGGVKQRRCLFCLNSQKKQGTAITAER